MLAIVMPKSAHVGTKRLRARNIIGIASAVVSLSDASTSDGSREEQAIDDDIVATAQGTVDSWVARARSNVTGWQWELQSYISGLSLRELQVLYQCVLAVGSLNAGLELMDGFKDLTLYDRMEHIHYMGGDLLGDNFLTGSEWEENLDPSSIEPLLDLQQNEISGGGERLIEEVKKSICDMIDLELRNASPEELQFNLYKSIIFVAATSTGWSGKRVSPALLKLKLREASVRDLRRVYDALKIEAIATKLNIMIPSQFFGRNTRTNRTVSLEQLRVLSANTSEYVQLPAAAVEKFSHHINDMSNNHLLCISAFCRHILCEPLARQKSLAWEFIYRLHLYLHGLVELTDLKCPIPVSDSTLYYEGVEGDFPSRAELEQLSGPAFTIYSAMIFSDYIRRWRMIQSYVGLIPPRLRHQKLLLLDIMRHHLDESYVLPPPPHPCIDITSKLDLRRLSPAKQYFVMNSWMNYVQEWKRHPERQLSDPTLCFLGVERLVGERLLRRAVTCDGAKCVQLLTERGGKMPATYAELVARMHEVIDGFAPHEFGPLRNLTPESPQFLREHYIRATCLANHMRGEFRPTAPVNYSKESYEFLGQLWNHQVKTNLEKRMGIQLENRFCDGLYKEMVLHSENAGIYPYFDEQRYLKHHVLTGMTIGGVMLGLRCAGLADIVHQQINDAIHAILDPESPHPVKNIAAGPWGWLW